jgi:hypothetical protein
MRSEKSFEAILRFDIAFSLADSSCFAGRASAAYLKQMRTTLLRRPSGGMKEERREDQAPYSG